MKESFLKRLQDANPVDEDVNVAPVIDCFTAIIAFMLVSATFLAIGVLDAAVNIGTAPDNTQSKVPPLAITLKLYKSKTIVFKYVGASSGQLTISPRGGDWDVETLKSRLNQYKRRFPTLQGVTINPTDGTDYEGIIKTMAAAQTVVPGALLGGFEDGT